MRRPCVESRGGDRGGQRAAVRAHHVRYVAECDIVVLAPAAPITPQPTAPAGPVTPGGPAGEGAEPVWGSARDGLSDTDTGGAAWVW